MEIVIFLCNKLERISRPLNTFRIVSLDFSRSRIIFNFDRSFINPGYIISKIQGISIFCDRIYLTFRNLRLSFYLRCNSIDLAHFDLSFGFKPIIGDLYGEILAVFVELVVLRSYESGEYTIIALGHSNIAELCARCAEGLDGDDLAAVLIACIYPNICIADFNTLDAEEFGGYRDGVLTSGNAEHIFTVGLCAVLDLYGTGFICLVIDIGCDKLGGHYALSGCGGDEVQLRALGSVYGRAVLFDLCALGQLRHIERKRSAHAARDADLDQLGLLRLVTGLFAGFFTGLFAGFLTGLFALRFFALRSCRLFRYFLILHNIFSVLRLSCGKAHETEQHCAYKDYNEQSEKYAFFHCFFSLIK